MKFIICYENLNVVDAGVRKRNFIPSMYYSILLPYQFLSYSLLSKGQKTSYKSKILLVNFGPGFEG
jgi:hypothetical protein